MTQSALLLYIFSPSSFPPKIISGLYNSRSSEDEHKKSPNYKESLGSAAVADTPSVAQIGWDVFLLKNNIPTNTVCLAMSSHNAFVVDEIKAFVATRRAQSWLPLKVPVHVLFKPKKK